MRSSGSALSSFSAGGGSSLFGIADAASDDDDDGAAEDDIAGGGGSPGGRRGMFSPFPQHRPFVAVEKTCWDDLSLPVSFLAVFLVHLEFWVEMLEIPLPQEETISVSTSSPTYFRLRV